MSAIKTLWYTRCPVPTPLGIAAQLGWIDEEFRNDGIHVRTLQDESDPKLRESHFAHHLENSVRQGGNIPAIWARASGRDTRVVGLTWTDEAQVILRPADSPLRSVADLKGKRLGVVTRPRASIDFWKATTLRAYQVALSLYGLGPSDVTLVELPQNDPPASLDETIEAQALRRGDVDVVFHKGSRGLELADVLGAPVLFDVGAHPDPAVRVNNGSPRTLTVDAGLLERDLGLVVRLVKRVVQAGHWAAAHRAEALAYLAKETQSAPAVIPRAYGPDFHQHLRTDLEPSSISALADFVRFLADEHFIPRAFDVHAWIEPRPLSLALAELAEGDSATIRTRSARA